MEEEDLSRQCRQGITTAQKELYEMYASRFLGLCHRYIPDYETARDVMHDGFIKIFQSFDKFNYRGKGSLRAWMERIIVNEALQYLRSSNQFSTIPIEEVADPADEPDTDTIGNIPESTLMKFIQELPNGYRTVFNLYVFEEKSHKEIASILHINEKSSSSQLYHAKALLAKRIEEWKKLNYDGV
jgi:RNA polymerase sigma-70 factor (ECF subfamily)